jgi:hypothetical protein
MPTIDELAPAPAAADTDELAANQAGITRKLTRAQLLSGLQPQISLPAGSLLGSPIGGTGAPQPIAIGANLSMTGATLSAAASSFSIPGLPPAQVPTASDLVPLGQGGQNLALAYAQFMSGLSTLTGIDASSLTVKATGGTAARSLGNAFADALPVEAFGAVGDGRTDDSAAFAAALASLRPLHLGAKTYIINGQFTIGAAVLFGVAGSTTIRRLTQTGNGAWLLINGPGFFADGIVFDANNNTVLQQSWGLLVASACTASHFSDCVFANATGATQGCGLTIQASDPAVTQHVIQGCEARGNQAHGIWVQAVDGAQILACRAHDNAGYGICLDFNDATFQQKARKGQVLGNECWNNLRGIAVGNFNQTNATPPVWGNANPDVIGAVIAANNCHDNTLCGIYVSGRALLIESNLLAGNGSAGNGGAGIQANVSYSRVSGNMVTGGSYFGIDSGGAIQTDISGNYVAGAVIGINPGGSQNVRVANNYLQDCSEWAITVNNVETDGNGNNFGLATSNLAITDNWISWSTAAAGGIYLIDAPQNVLVARNNFAGLLAAAQGMCLWAHSDTVIIEGNRWNNTQRFICNPVTNGTLTQVQFPDIADAIMLTAAPAPIQSLMSLHQLSAAGQITFIKVTAGGSGYTHAAITVSGAGSGCTASAYIANGAVLGITVTQPGSGYGSFGATANVIISGDGTGAAATASVGLPVPEERRLLVACNSATAFACAGSSPGQQSWTGFDFTAPANSEVEWVGTWNGWRARQFPPGEYLQTGTDGTLTLASAATADLILKPASGGHLRFCTATEATGVMSVIGRGTPLGVVPAPPGSDYRNLNGGAGNTFWIKVSATDATGWVAVA